MKKTMILLAGYPATGKTFLCNQILKKYPDFVVISQDEIKENLWEQYGFNNLEEKIELEMQAWEMYYEIIEKNMKKSNSIISDYPFSQKQKGGLEKFSKTYEYQVITFRLIGDIDILYQRSLKRDLDQGRHLAHLVTCYHKGDILKDRRKADELVTYEIFKERCKMKGYDKFQLGHLFELDVTDYAKINYDKILTQLGELLDENE